MYFFCHFLTYWISNIYYFYHDIKIWNNKIEWDKVKLQKWRSDLSKIWCEASINSLRNNFLTFLIIYLIPKPSYYFDIVDLLKIPLYLIINDIYFYFFHYLMHSKLLYHFHKQHHKVAMSVSPSALDSGMLEHIFVNIGSIISPYLILGGSKVLFLLVIISFTLNTCIIHSGYKRKDITHDIHHQLLKYNYGTKLGLMDRFFGTYRNSIR